MRSDRVLRPLASVIVAVLPFVAVDAFDADGGWPSGTVPMRLMLDSSTAKPAIPSGGLIDGGTSWNVAVAPALTAWNEQMSRTQFTTVAGSEGAGARNNGVNEVFFSSTAYGEAFGTNVLAVAISRRAGTFGLRITECDVLFNAGVTWNSYRGNQRSSVDVQRVALHEFGHVIGLDHPDQATPRQNIPAIMNSTVSSLHLLQADDINGANRIYNNAVRQPVITKNPVRISVAEGADGGELSVELDGLPPPDASDILKYAWIVQPASGAPPEQLFTINEARITLGAAQLVDAGTYTVSVETPLGETRSASAVVTVSPTSKSTGTRLANLSTRGVVGNGNRALIVGFVIAGNESRRVLVRAVAPTLAAPPFNLSGTISDPVLDVTNSSAVTVASNDDWHAGGAEAELQAAFSVIGAFPLLDGSADAAVITTLPPGSFTAAISSKSGTEGLAIVEAYDLDGTADESNRLINLSTRGFVGTGDQIMIAGFVVSGTGPRKYILRGVGDTLKDFGVPEGYLDDTTLELYDSTGALLRKTDDWDSPAFFQPELTAAFTAAGAFQLTDRQESAMLLTLHPGTYTIHLAGFENSTGLALAEIYEVSN